jgi:hypothetical protein
LLETLNPMGRRRWNSRLLVFFIGIAAVVIGVAFPFVGIGVVLFVGIVVVAGVAFIAASAVAGFADFLFRGQLIAFVGDGHGADKFGGRMEGFAIDILRGDLDGVEEQAGVARIKAGAEVSRCDLVDGNLDGGGILQHGEIDVIPDGAFGFGHGMHAGVEITVSRLAESRRLASSSVGFDMTAKIVHRIPPPIFCKQIPCFLEFTGRVAPQNLENKGVPCKIVQDKELRGCFGLCCSFWPEPGAKRTYLDDDLKGDF